MILKSSQMRLSKMDKSFSNDSQGGLNDIEDDVMKSLVNAWNRYLTLPLQHSDDITSFRESIHTCQQLLMIRQVRRQYPNVYFIA